MAGKQPSPSLGANPWDWARVVSQNYQQSADRDSRQAHDMRKTVIGQEFKRQDALSPAILAQKQRRTGSKKGKSKDGSVIGDTDAIEKAKQEGRNIKILSEQQIKFHRDMGEPIGIEDTHELKATSKQNGIKTYIFVQKAGAATPAETETETADTTPASIQENTPKSDLSTDPTSVRRYAPKTEG